MELGLSNTVLAGDPRLIDHIVGEVKSQGIFDQFRKECIADVDTKPAYQNLRTRVEGSVNSFLNKQIWKPDLNKNQLRETLRKHIHDAPYLDAGVERIVDQVVNPKVYSVFMPQVEDVVYKFLGIERPKAKEKNGACGLKDLLPKDLDPVSPESDKNSLKDVSLESIDTNDNLDEKQDDKICDEQTLQDMEVCEDKNKDGSENGHIFLEEKMSDDACKTLNKTGSNLNLNISGKSDDKMDEEEEEVSPTFEPIDIMNLNESNISNDSHLSGISELTSHRSRSPDFSNELSRDNFDCSNQDSQLSKVSSDSRLSIITDFGSSNHDFTPVHDTSKDEATKDKYETKSSKDNFKAIREFDLSKNKSAKSSFDFSKSKDTQDYPKDFKNIKNVSSKENSRDATDSGIKDKYEHKSSKEKNKDSESIKSSKSTKEKVSSKDTKYYKDRSNEKKKTSSHSSMKYDKHNKNKFKDKIDQTRESSDKIKDFSENVRDNLNKFKDEKETDKKDNRDKRDNVSKEAKDLKDLYKEKIRELREKKELTEKEKLNKDKEVKLTKEAKDRKDSPKDKKSDRKEHRSSSSSSSKNLSVPYHESKSNKMSEKTADGKDKRSDAKDKIKRDEKRLSKDNKGKSHYSSKTDLSDKSDSRKTFKGEKDDKIGKTDMKKDVRASGEKMSGKKDAKNHPQQGRSSDRNEKLDGRKDSRNDSPSKDKKRREDKKSKMKDDHSSLRKNSNDRRSTDRDGSNGSNSKTSPSNNSSSNITSNKSGTSSLTKENHISNSSSETSDSIEETQVNDSKSSNCKLPHKTCSQLSANDKGHPKMETDGTHRTYDKRKGEQTDSNCDTSLPLKKRLLSSKDDESLPDDVKMKKPKFAKNIHEAKKLMKIRKQMEKQRLKEDKKVDRKDTQETEQTSQSSATRDSDNLAGVPDDERVQIIEIPDEEYEQPYPEQEPNLRLDERSLIMLGAESCTNELLNKRSNLKTTLSDMELCIRQSLSEIVTNMPSGEAAAQSSNVSEKIVQPDDSLSDQCSTTLGDTCSAPHVEGAAEDLQTSEERHGDNSKESSEKNAIAETEEKRISQKQEEITISEELESMNHDLDKITKQLTEENVEVRDCNQAEMQDDNEKIQNNSRSETWDDTQIEMCTKADTADSQASDCTGSKSSSSVISEENEDCRYFKTDNEKSDKFSNFLESLELMESSSLEDIIESLGGKVVSSVPKSMAAPPLPKLRKRSSSPLSDILVNNSDNNNDGHKRTSSSSPNEDTVHNVKKRKFTKKPRSSSLCNPQGISNGENFVMPLSPDSDVSATSEKTTTSSNVIKEEKSRNRSSQRYSSDDLYKPRPLFSSSSRRSRRSNQA